MSRTIITNSGSQFLTNISSEKVIGELCKLVGAKYSNDYLELKNDHIKRSWDTSKIDKIYEDDLIGFLIKWLILCLPKKRMMQLLN